MDLLDLNQFKSTFLTCILDILTCGLCALKEIAPKTTKLEACSGQRPALFIQGLNWRKVCLIYLHSHIQFLQVMSGYCSWT